MDLRNRNISVHNSIIEALKKMDEIGKKLLIVFDGDQYAGLLSVGDIQRAIIKNIALDTMVKDIMRTNVVAGKPEDRLDDIKEIMLMHRIELYPVIDLNNRLVHIYFWEDFFSDENTIPLIHFNLPVIIMAGGLGTRLKPLTNVLPKPLVPINEKSMLEEIIDRFSVYGCDKFHISVNYKAEFIEYYINSLKLKQSIFFVREDKPLGTAGSLRLMVNKINSTFFVTNCDILIEQDYSEIYKYHLDNNNEITIVAALKSVNIPYGILETGERGTLSQFKEKPEITLKINSGMYILEPHLLTEIPEDRMFHITQLIQSVQDRGGKVGVFPVSEKSWKDVGDWDEYINNWVKT